MPVFLCRCANGDTSIVAARNKDDVIVKLDEFDNADHAKIFQLKEFLVDFRLRDDGNQVLNYETGEYGFGEETFNEIMEKTYAELEKTRMLDPLVWPVMKSLSSEIQLLAYFDEPE